jgi:hypothetical protein
MSSEAGPQTAQTTQNHYGPTQNDTILYTQLSGKRVLSCMTRILPAVMLIALGWAVAAPAQPRQAELQQEQRANHANLNSLRQLRLDAAARNDTAAVKEYEQSIEELLEDIRSLQEQLKKIGTTAAEIGPEPPALDGVAAPPLRAPPCADCKGSVDALQKEHLELQRRAERANATKAQDVLRDFEAQRRRVRDLQRQLDDCGKQCTLTETRSFWSSPVIGAAAGGAVLAGLLARGGDDPTAVVPPIASPPTPTQPPAGPPTIAGVHDCIQCAVLDDEGGNNALVRLCDFVSGPWEVVVASITIRHAPPFVNIEGASFDAAAGMFSGTTSGTVAGVPNVGISFEGATNMETGRIAFIYTIGTGGELPGGQDITYRIDLQKRR